MADEKPAFAPNIHNHGDVGQQNIAQEIDQSQGKTEINAGDVENLTTGQENIFCAAVEPREYELFESLVPALTGASWPPDTPEDVVERFPAPIDLLDFAKDESRELAKTPVTDEESEEKERTYLGLFKHWAPVLVSATVASALTIGYKIVTDTPVGAGLMAFLDGVKKG